MSINITNLKNEEEELLKGVNIFCLIE